MHAHPRNWIEQFSARKAGNQVRRYTRARRTKDYPFQLRPSTPKAFRIVNPEIEDWIQAVQRPSPRHLESLVRIYDILVETADEQVRISWQPRGHGHHACIVQTGYDFEARKEAAQRIQTRSSAIVEELCVFLAGLSPSLPALVIVRGNHIPVRRRILRIADQCLT